MKELPQVEEIARAFCAVLSEWLTEAQMSEVRRLNTDPKYAGCCASHNFCDANEAMDEAFRRCGVEVLETGIPDTDWPLMSQEATDLWNTAWSMAKLWRFFVHDFVVFIPRERHDLHRGRWITSHKWKRINFQDLDCRQMMVRL